MTQQATAKALLAQLFRSPRNCRVRLSEKYLRSMAQKRWVDKDERLTADALIDEAEAQVAEGTLKKFRRGSTQFYSPR